MTNVLRAAFFMQNDCAQDMTSFPIVQTKLFNALFNSFGILLFGIIFMVADL